MKKLRFWGVMFLLTALILAGLPTTEADAATSASDFKMDGDTLTRYAGVEASVSVPGTVAKIGRSAFEDNDRVKLVVMSDSVKRIEPYAFWGCDRLESVVLGRGLGGVDDFVFADCQGLRTMTLPSNITYIGICSFADCVNLTDITIPPEVTNIHETAFDGCYRLTIHAEPGSYADRYAQEFYKRQKEMPEYEDVDQYQDPLPTDAPVTVPVPTSAPVQEPTGDELGSVRVVGNQAVVFMDNSSPQVLDGGATGLINGIFPSGGSDRVEYPILREPGQRRKFTIVDSRIVADQAYYRSRNIDRLSVPAGIEEIGQFAFARSTVSEVALPQGLKTISYGAFYQCDRLQTVTIPDSVEKVEPKAFAGSAWAENFSGDFLISGGVLVAYHGNHETVTIPDGVRVIAAEALADHEELRELILPNSLQFIGEGAFQDCVNLAGVTWPERLKAVSDRAFYHTALAKVVLPASVEEVGLLSFDETTVVETSGAEPEKTHEASAERLSNMGFRGLKTNQTSLTGAVRVEGVSPAYASLSGADRNYTLTVSETGKDRLSQAYQRAQGVTLPEPSAAYLLTLSDESGIPLTKLGKQGLTVTMVLPEALRGQKVRLFVVDRNSQLEWLSCEPVKITAEGQEQPVDGLTFTVNYLSEIGICGTGEPLEDGVSIVTTSFESMSSGPDGGLESAADGGAQGASVVGSEASSRNSFANSFRVWKYPASAFFLLAGLTMCLISFRRRL